MRAHKYGWWLDLAIIYATVGTAVVVGLAAVFVFMVR